MSACRFTQNKHKSFIFFINTNSLELVLKNPERMTGHPMEMDTQAAKQARQQLRTMRRDARELLGELVVDHRECRSQH
jgi:pyruvate formate-lyase activating enzyme-like uncharacterized protein